MAAEKLTWRREAIGVRAIQGSSASSTDGTQAFDPPAACLAGINVDPPGLVAAQVANTSTTQTLTIQNGSLGGGNNLVWSIAEAPSSCASPSDVPWVSVSPTNGTTAPGGRSEATVTFSSAGLSTPSSHSAKLCVTSNDRSRPVIEIPLTLGVIYNFQGFFGSTKNPPAINRVNAGSTQTLAFSLSGDHGFDIFEAGSPSSHEIDCDTKAPRGESEPSIGGGGNNGLSYDSSTDRYTYRWRTQGDWLAGSCRELTMKLDDGTTHRAFFEFR